MIFDIAIINRLDLVKLSHPVCFYPRREVVEMNIDLWAMVVATVFVLVGYVVAGCSGRKNWGKISWLNPLNIAAGSDRVASLSTLQIFFFTIIVLWLSVYWVVKESTFYDINTDIALLLGISLAGSTIGKITDKSRSRLTQENFCWLKEKGWIKNDLIKGSKNTRQPKFSDLITVNGKLDMARFQAVGFSLIVGGTLFIEGIGATNGIRIPEAYLTLIGISQGAYVGGKFTTKNSFQQLNVKLDAVRDAELSLKKKLITDKTWKDASGSKESDQLLDLAREYAGEEYITYEQIAEEASYLVSDMTGCAIGKSMQNPSLPE
ncbi:MAG: hypothetical protein OXI24_19125 [Candidatus Poribacteria bacterium]|nr:hypothetical protein [Candidatus Poribacteria bacterium]